MKKYLPISTLILIATPLTALAQTSGDENLIDSTGEVIDVLNNIGTWLFTFLLISATIMLVIAAYNYLFSGGEQEKVAAAKNTIVYAVIALAVAMMAKGIPLIIRTLITP